MIRLDVPRSVERELASRAVRSTAVSPEERFRKDREGFKRDYQRALFNDSESKRKAAVAPDGHRPTSEYEAQKGIELTCEQICLRLRKCANYPLWFEVANADKTKMGIYHLDPSAEGGRRFICGFERGKSPEFSVREVDDEGNFKREIRGWRTVLSKLIRKGFISKAKSDALFGPPTRDSHNWHTLTN